MRKELFYYELVLHGEYTLRDYVKLYREKHTPISNCPVIGEVDFYFDTVPLTYLNNGDIEKVISQFAENFNADDKNEHYLLRLGFSRVNSIRPAFIS